MLAVVDPLTIVVLLGSGLLYGAGLRRLAARGAKVDRRAAAWFYSGLVALVVALGPPIGGLSDRSFAWHMTQHVLLVFVVPPLLALGAPITLALRASSSITRTGILLPLLRSRVARVLANPLVGWVGLVVVSFAVHLTGVFDLALRSVPVHLGEHLVWIGVAFIYWWPIVGRDPSPHRVAYPVRLLSLLLLMPAMSFLALSLYAAGQPLYPAYLGGTASVVEVLADQRVAAVVMWLVGNLILVVAMLLVAVGWKHDEERREAARERGEAQRATASSDLG